MRLLPARRRSRVILGVVAAVVVVGALAVIAYATPLMAVRTTDVDGNHAVSRDQVLAAAQVPDGTPLLQVDTGAIARRVAGIESVASAQVRRSYPSTLTITIVERRPVAVVDNGGKLHVLDPTGVSFREADATTAPPDIKKLPVLETPNAGPGDPSTVAALHAAAGLPPDLATQVVGIHARSPVAIEFDLTRNRKVVWGDDENGPAKARALGQLLTRKATSFNVSSPDFPAYR